MNLVNYNPLAEVMVSHEYYRDGLFRDLEVKADQKTQKFMNRYGFLLRETPTGFSIYCDRYPSKEDIEYLADIMVSSLNFDLYSQNSWYTNFTQIPLNQLSYQYFSNEQAENNTVLVPETIKASSSSGKVARVSIHLKQLINGGDFVPGKYHIQFEARACQWQYYLVNSNRIEATDLVINGLDGEAFEGPESVKNPGGEEALFFTSGTRQYALKEYPKAYCTLSKKSNGAIRPVRRLPAAVPSSVSAGTSKAAHSELAISSIYIYL